jgi:hypothetical protein
MNESGLTPAYQRLFHNERELDNEETIEIAHILAGDTIVCKEVIIEDLTLDDEAMEERGFGGTALRGRQGEPLTGPHRRDVTRLIHHQLARTVRSKMTRAQQPVRCAKG